jgi:sulfopropanediol 3-dehydrogenase
VQGNIADIVQIMLARLRVGGAEAARDYAQRLDGWAGDIIVSPDDIARASQSVPDEVKQAIGYAHDTIRRFAEAQRASISDFQTDLHPGLTVGQKMIPVGCAGCYIPGGRYAHIASALMTVTTARAAGVPHVVAATPTRGDHGADPAILYTAQLAGANKILQIGGVQGIAAMAWGQFGTPPADVLAGPGNAYAPSI